MGHPCRDVSCRELALSDDLRSNFISRWLPKSRPFLAARIANWELD